MCVNKEIVTESRRVLPPASKNLRLYWRKPDANISYGVSILIAAARESNYYKLYYLASIMLFINEPVILIIDFIRRLPRKSIPFCMPV